ncbi:MAG: putative ABC transporter ATP-binding protein [Candidatus Magasanikbacteria bacterium]|nr:putative ABC transporter ATP-binding protein [Candidatus Magasanikbacteria bacterium]
MHPLLTVEHLSVKFGQNVIVDDVSFSIFEGQVLALVGPNGAGKTTLMRAVLGLVPYEGQVEWHEPAALGFVPQRLDFDRTVPLTVTEIFIAMRGRAIDVPKALSLLGASHLAASRLGDLSGGELQRVMLALALSGKPKMLFLDEPASGIDVGGGETIYSLIHDLAERGRITVFLISHDLDVVFKFADEVLCINKNMLCRGVPTKVLTSGTLKQMYGEHVSHFSHGHHRTH